jgi:hypothetical protein
MRTGFTTGFTARAAAAVMAGAAAAAVAGLAVPAGAAPRVAAKVTGTEHFQIMSTSATSSAASTIAWGAFTTHGADHMGNSADTLVFPGGSIKIKHSAGTGPQSFDPKTCLFQAHIHGTYKVAGGTGKYKGITGHGNYTVSVIGLGAKTKSGACSQTAAAVAQQQVIDASGPVTLP